MPKKLLIIGGYASTVLLKILLIPFILNDYLLAAVYGLFIVALLRFRPEQYDKVAFIIGLVCITISEYFFISTGVETFHRVSFLGVMPIWLPLLWAYAFVVIKRSMRMLVSGK